MAESVKMIKKLIERYDYCGAHEILKELGLENTDTGVLINSCRYAVNFDFFMARKQLRLLSKEAQKMTECQLLIDNLDALNEMLDEKLNKGNLSMSSIFGKKK